MTSQTGIFRGREPESGSDNPLRTQSAANGTEKKRAVEALGALS
jgi:hypothetical protein